MGGGLFSEPCFCGLFLGGGIFFDPFLGVFLLFFFFSGGA